MLGHLQRDIHDLKSVYKATGNWPVSGGSPSHLLSGQELPGSGHQGQRLQQQLERKLLAQCRP